MFSRGFATAIAGLPITLRATVESTPVAAYTRGVVFIRMENPMLRIALPGVLGLLLIPAAHAAVDCSAGSITPLPLPATVIAPVAPELYTRQVQLGMPAGVLTSNFSDDQSLARVLLRLRVEGCQNIAKVTPANPAVIANDPAAYKPATEFDNTPWRFDMNQGGKNMTAEEFDAWMKARGVRVGKARPAPVEPAAAEPAPADVK